jgi:hypothetical protein
MPYSAAHAFPGDPLRNRIAEGRGVHAYTVDLPASLLCTLHPPVAQRGATPATGLPAKALTGPDFHRPDFFEWFHRLISDPPPAFFPAR